MPANYVTDEGEKLGKWLHRQRAKYNGASNVKGCLSDTEIKLLEKIGMVWRMEYRFRWEEWIEVAREYREEHGDLLVPNNYVTEDGYRLGVWISEQRGKCSHRKGKRSVTAYEAFLLNEIGMVWDISKHSESEWENKYLEVERFYKEYGKLPTYLGDMFASDGKRMDYWIKTQRLYLTEGRYSEDRITRLKQIGIKGCRKYKQTMS